MSVSSSRGKSLILSNSDGRDILKDIIFELSVEITYLFTNKSPDTHLILRKKKNPETRELFQQITQ